MRKEFENYYLEPEEKIIKRRIKIIKKLKKMSKQELLQTFVDAGIVNPDGSLTDYYKRK